VLFETKVVEGRVLIGVELEFAEVVEEFELIMSKVVEETVVIGVVEELSRDAEDNVSAF